MYCKVLSISGNKKVDNLIREMQLKIENEEENKKIKKYIIIKDLNISGNKKVDNLIQEMQLKIKNTEDIIFEWIPYNQFDNIKKINEGDFATIYSAIWKDGPLHYNYDN